jgi:hypothetical protein
MEQEILYWMFLAVSSKSYEEAFEIINKEAPSADNLQNSVLRFEVISKICGIYHSKKSLFPKKLIEKIARSFLQNML